MNPWHLYQPEDLPEAYEKHVRSIISIGGGTVNAVRLEFDASDGHTYVADVAPPGGPRPGSKKPLFQIRNIKRGERGRR